MWALKVKLYLYIIIISFMSKNTPRLLNCIFIIYMYCRMLHVSSLSLISSHSFSFIPFQVCVNPHFDSWWIRSSFQNPWGLSSNILVHPLGVKTCFQCYIIFLDLIYLFMSVHFVLNCNIIFPLLFDIIV